MKHKCICCNQQNHDILWNDKIRTGKKSFSKNKTKLIICENCGLVSLKEKTRKLENSSIARNLYNKDNSIKEFIKFHKPREIKKIKFIEKYFDFEGKKVLESNCGSGILINYLKKKTLHTAGLDDRLYQSHVKKNGHNFFSSIDEIKNAKKKFDVILSLSELEHKFNPYVFLEKLKKILNKDGHLIIRIPNYKNIYMFLLGYNFLRYDFRSSHNYYFSENNLDLLFSKLNLKIIQKLGMNEYNFNHLLTYLDTGKRVRINKIKKFVNNKRDNQIVANIEKNMISTSLLYILSK
jgi:2-polyprenyl-3-methyl-5-hydroxy-6-metoxy-1,4-benzoquinol methylase